MLNFFFINFPKTTHTYTYVYNITDVHIYLYTLSIHTLYIMHLYNFYEHLCNNSMVSSAMKYCIQTFLIYNAKLFELHFVHYHKKGRGREGKRAHTEAGWKKNEMGETLEKTCCILSIGILFIHQLYINTLLSMLNIRLDIFFISFRREKLKRNKYSKDKWYGVCSRYATPDFTVKLGNVCFVHIPYYKS